jgi:Raf kinase inhibitor-like YbhB/YbcL family protein
LAWQVAGVRRSFALAVIGFGIGGALVAGTVAGASDDEVTTMRLVSAAFSDEQVLPVRFTCWGEGVSPPLSWFDVPDGAKSLVLMMEALDDGGGMVNWLVYDVPPVRTGFGSDTAPADARVGLNDEGRRRYEAPCARRPARYVFTVHALDRRLDLEDADATRIRRAMAKHVLAKGYVVVTAPGPSDDR